MDEGHVLPVLSPIIVQTDQVNRVRPFKPFPGRFDWLTPLPKTSGGGAPGGCPNCRIDYPKIYLVWLQTPLGNVSLESMPSYVELIYAGQGAVAGWQGCG